MNLELKECWWLILIILSFAWLIGEGVGEYKNSNKQDYSLGFAECKAGMPHRYIVNESEESK